MSIKRKALLIQAAGGSVVLALAMQPVFIMGYGSYVWILFTALILFFATGADFKKIPSIIASFACGLAWAALNGILMGALSGAPMWVSGILLTILMVFSILAVHENLLRNSVVGNIPSLALRIEDRNDLFRPGYLECETGYCIMEDGSGYLANHTFMPGVTREMFEWWFAWHSVEDLRYRIWDPEDHYYARNQNMERVLDASLPMRERTWGTQHVILEDIGSGTDFIIR